MILSFAFGLIGALLVLANCRYLRRTGIALLAFLLTAILAAVGWYLITHAEKKSDLSIYSEMFTPLTALVLYQLARMLYFLKMKKEIILHLHGLFPVRPNERYVTQTEKFITFILLITSVLIPFLILNSIRP